MPPLRIIFFGSGAFGLPTLQHLAAQHQLAAIVTQPDKPAGRGGQLTPTPIGAYAAANLPTLPLFKPVKVNDPAVVEHIRAIPVDAWVVIAYGQKLSARLLVDRFAINLHASLLPRWRGAAPIHAAILSGDTFTGNSVITLADRMDAGLVLAQTTPPLPISPTITTAELHDQLAADGPALVNRVLAQHHQGTLASTPQEESQVTIATKLSKDDGVADFNQPADFLRRQVHSLTPWPGVQIVLGSPGERGQTLKLLRVQTTPAGHTQTPGTLIDPALGRIACGNHTTLDLLEVQPPGKKPMKWSDFARGAKMLRAGMRVQSAREAV